jgi:hypothetical protein
MKKLRPNKEYYIRGNYITDGIMAVDVYSKAVTTATYNRAKQHPGTDLRCGTVERRCDKFARSDKCQRYYKTSVLVEGQGGLLMRAFVSENNERMFIDEKYVNLLGVSCFDAISDTDPVWVVVDGRRDMKILIMPVRSYKTIEYRLDPFA